MSFDVRTLPRFRPRRPWIGGDLQTVRNLIMRPRFDLSAWPMRKLTFSAASVTDQLSGYWHRQKQESDKPTVILLHGLTGSADGVTICATAHHLLKAGFPVVRMNLRGAGDTAGQCKTQYHTGLTEDVSNVLDQLPPEAVRGGVFLFGYSLGGNMALKFIGERKGFGLVKGVVAVCPPMDLRMAIEALERPRNIIYQTRLLVDMKRGALKCDLSVPLRRAIKDARSIYDYDDKVTAPMHGFADAEDFYASNSSKRLLEKIETRALVIHSADDPWIPVRMMRSTPWAAMEALTYVEAPSGGHCGFHGSRPHFLWHNEVATRFLKDVAEKQRWGQV
jgi:uncharacterized protein